MGKSEYCERVMLLSSVSLALATTNKSVSTNGNTSLKNEFRQPKGKLEATLKLGVSSNIITQAEIDKILVCESSKIKTKHSKEKTKWKNQIYLKK